MHVVSIADTVLADLPVTTYKLLLSCIMCLTGAVVVVVIYRPPSSSITLFAQELSMLLDRLISCDIILCGDLNCPVTDGWSIDTRLDRVKSDCNLTQHVKCPTHIGGNMLDLLFTINAHPAISNVRVADFGVADHYLVTCDVTVSQIKSQVSDGLMANAPMPDKLIRTALDCSPTFGWHWMS